MGVDDIKYGNPTLGQLKVIREDVGGESQVFCESYYSNS